MALLAGDMPSSDEDRSIRCGCSKPIGVKPSVSEERSEVASRALGIETEFLPKLIQLPRRHPYHRHGKRALPSRSHTSTLALRVSHDG
jgi:hypothetical protein